MKLCETIEKNMQYESQRLNHIEISASDLDRAELNSLKLITLNYLKYALSINEVIYFIEFHKII